MKGTGFNSDGSPDKRRAKRRCMWRVPFGGGPLMHLAHPLTKDHAAYCGATPSGGWVPGPATGYTKCTACEKWHASRPNAEGIETGFKEGRVYGSAWKMRPPKPAGDGWIYVAGKWQQPAKKEKKWYELG